MGFTLEEMNFFAESLTNEVYSADDYAIEIHVGDTVPSCMFEREGYTFLNWSSNSENANANLLPDTNEITQLNPNGTSGEWTYVADSWSHMDCVTFNTSNNLPYNLKHSVTLKGCQNSNIGSGVYSLNGELNQNYTISCYVKGEGLLYLAVGFNGGTGNAQYSSNLIQVDDVNNWSYVELSVYTTGKMVQYGKMSAYFENHSRTSGQNLEICGMKLEKGKVGTDYTSNMTSIAYYPDDIVTAEDLPADGKLYPVWMQNKAKYTVCHELMNADGVTYTRMEQDTEYLYNNIGTIVYPQPKEYDGYITPESQKLIIKKSEGENRIVYRYALQKENYVTITQRNYLQEHNDYNNGGLGMFYTVQDQNGGLVIIDGGYGCSDYDDGMTDEILHIIEENGNHVNAWILTHAHYDHAGVFLSLMEESQYKSIREKIVIDKIYTTDYYENDVYDIFQNNEVKRFYTLLDNMSNVEYLSVGDELNLLGLKMTVYNSWTNKTNKIFSEFDNGDYNYATDKPAAGNYSALMGNVINCGSLMFKLCGKEQSFLITSDVQWQMEDSLAKTYGDALMADFIQVSHHALNGETICKTFSYDFYKRNTGSMLFVPTPWFEKSLADEVIESEIPYTTFRNGSYPIIMKAYYEDTEPLCGDVNADGIFDIADIYMLQKWLIGAGDLKNKQAGDVCKDNVINVFDLCLLKRKFVNQNQINFCDNMNNWKSYVNNNCKANLLRIKNGITMEITDSGTNIWDVQASYKNLTFEEGVTYKLSFDYRANNNAKVWFTILQDYGNYDDYFDEYVDFIGDKQHYEATFTMQEATDRKCQITFNCGGIDTYVPIKLTVTNLELIKLS